MSLSVTAKYIITIIISQLAGIIGSLFTAPSIQTWYSHLNRPTFSPPNWLFAPVWTILFLLMGIAAGLVWSAYTPVVNALAGKKVSDGQVKKNIKIALAIFGIQLILNTLWSILFFGLHSPLYALVEIVLLWIAIFVTIITFYKISKPAAWLLAPYIAWVSFAVYLNYSFWILN